MNVRGLNRMFSFDGYRIDGVTFSPEIVQVQLRVDKRKRLCCPGCDGKVRSEISEPRTARDLPNTKAAALLGVGDTRLRSWDKAVLAEHLPKPDLDNIQFLMIDEKAIGKGHDYVTVVLNGESGESLHCHEGKKRNRSRLFLRLSASFGARGLLVRPVARLALALSKDKCCRCSRSLYCSIHTVASG